ncbi:MAG TPA: hypothetical protein VFK19_08535 [Sphingomicrobium sp.]|nr:hypothetical protein [Sphingomicrobium sp.]
MKKLATIFAATALVASAGPVMTVPANAATRHHHRHHHARTRYRHRVCRYSNGTTGLVAGGVVGAVAGPNVVGHGVLGAAAGAVGGAIAGRAIDRSITARQRCYNRR